MEQQSLTRSVTHAQKTKKLKEKSIGIDEDDVHTENKAVKDDFSSYDEIHPLKNPVILTRMFQLCPQHLLAKFRLVSKEWHQLSLQSWRSTVTIIFHRDHLTAEKGDFFWKPTNSSSTSSSTTLQKFLDYVKNPTNEHSSKPFRKYILDFLEFRELDDQIEQFVKICGPFITTLELRLCKYRELTIFRNVLFKWFPNLKKLILTSFDCRWSFTKPAEPVNFIEPEHGVHQNLKHLEINRRTIEYLPVSCLELLSRYPRLEALKLYLIDDRFIVEMLHAIKVIRKHDKRQLQIKDLNIFNPSIFGRNAITPEIGILLCDAQLPLEVMTFDFDTVTKPERIKEILEWNATTLKKLTIYRNGEENFPFGIQLDNLQELVMSKALCKSLTFMKYMPNLKKLHILDAMGSSYLQKLFDCREIVPNTDPKILRDIKLVKCIDLMFPYDISKDDTKVLMELLPNVEKVRMAMNTEQFRLACQKWPNLRDLEVLGNQLGDTAITGFRPEDVEAVNMADEKAGSLAVAPVRIHPNITDLIHLQKIKMVQCQTKQLFCSAFHGFLKLPYLECLHVICLKMNDRVRKALHEKIPKCQIRDFSLN